MYSGNRVSVIDENSISKINDCRVIVLPDTQYVTKSMLEALKSYAANGGKIIAIGNNCLKYDDYKKANAQSDINAVLDGAKRFSSSYSSYQLQNPTCDQIAAEAKKMAGADISIQDADTGEILNDVECRYTDYNGKMLVNLCRYKWESRNVNILLGGKKILGFYNLITEDMEKTVKLDGYTPVMGYILDKQPEKPKDAGTKWENGEYKIKWESQEKYVNIYKDNELIESVPADEGEYTFADDYGKTISLTATDEYGFESEKTDVSLKDFETWLDSENGLLKICGYSSDMANITYKIVENGKDPRKAMEITAIGEEFKKGYFEIDVPIEVSYESQKDFVVYVSDGNHKDTLFYSYIKTVAGLTDVIAYYYGGRYNISWNTDIEENISISDGNQTYVTAASVGKYVLPSEQSNKEFTISSSKGAGSVIMPTPLMAYCRLVDSVLSVSGISRANTKILIQIKNNDTALFSEYVDADEYGRFQTSCTIGISVNAGEDLDISIIADDGTGKCIKAEYNGQFPLGILNKDGNKIVITSYTAKNIANAKVIYAEYYNSVLKNCLIYDLTIGGEESVISELPAGSTAVYIWDGMNSLIPLARAYKR